MNTNRKARAAMFTAAIIVLALGVVAGVPAQMAHGGSGGRGAYGPGYGMMGQGDRGNGGYGYGMMRGFGNAQGSTQATYEQAMTLLEESRRSAQVDKAKNEVIFTGKQISIAIAAVEPGFDDTTFEVAGLVNPTIVVPAGSEVTLTFINMDYGNDMSHGVVITPIRPPYPPLGMMGMPNSFAGVPVLEPRSAANAGNARYAEGSTTFIAPRPGSYYYLCQYYDHASKGMYGRFIVTNG